MLKIVSCFWNASEYIASCIASVKTQTCQDFRMFLINDVSTDLSVDILKKAIGDDSRFVLINNPEKRFKIKGLDLLMRDTTLLDDEDIIIELDGDDWFANTEVLSFIRAKYDANPDLWLTNGSFVYNTGEKGFSDFTDYRTVRKKLFTFSHLRTWKCHLWRRIKPEDLKDYSGNYFNSAVDLAYSFPLVEMAGANHYEYVPQILYVYNATTPYNEFKEGSPGGGRFQQMRCELELRSKQPYEPLD